MFVVWSAKAEDSLADVYTELHLFEQRALAATVQRINRELADNPWALGEERDPGYRTWFPGPLQIVFRLVPGGGVQVVECGPNPPRRR
jgi:plasmid stabilization system protein ParE